jgi:hypothetical protein
MHASFPALAASSDVPAILHSLALVASSISFTILDSSYVTDQTKKIRFHHNNGTGQAKKKPWKKVSANPNPRWTRERGISPGIAAVAPRKKGKEEEATDIGGGGRRRQGPSGARREVGVGALALDRSGSKE